MPGFRDRRIVLLTLALLLSGLFIVAPWKEPQAEGAPLPNTIRGPNWGIDITGGSRIMLYLKATQVTVGLPENVENYSTYIETLQGRLRKKFEVPVSWIRSKENVAETGTVKFEIGKHVTEKGIRSVLQGNERVIGKPEKSVRESTREKVQNSLKKRVDPYGTLGAQFKPLGEKNQYLQFEVALPLEEAKRLLGKEGLPEVFIDNIRVVWSEHIRNVDVSARISKVQQKKTWNVTFSLIEEGRKRFAKYTGGGENIPGKKGRPGVIYLDRPADSVLLFTQEFENKIKSEIRNYQEKIRLENVEYCQSAHSFRYKPIDDPTTPSLYENHWFYIPVAAAKIRENVIPPKSENYILSQRQEEEIDQALLLGEKKDFLNIQNDNLIIDNRAVLPVENSTRMANKNELYIEWLNRIVGLKSWPTLKPAITGSEENIKQGLSIETGSGEEAESRAKDLRIILSQRLDVKVTHVSEEEIGGRLSEGFMKQAAIAGLAAFAVVGILVFSFYRRFKIVIPLLLTMASEVVITLGAASAVPDGLMSIGLPGLGGLIAVVGTGVDHQIIITDEVLGKKLSEKGKLPIDRRTSRAFAVIFAAAATTIAAMIALAYFGFGAMRGFAIVTLFGVLISILITRPAYARIIGILLEREQKKKSGG